MKGFKLLIPAIAASQLGATNCGEVLKDPGFDLWCGDTLCAWKVERGDIARAPTWHEKDAGVGFTGADDAIEQLAPVTDHDGTCLVFDLIADVDTNAEVTLNIDVEGDGTIERTEQIPTAHWQPLTYAIAIAPPFDGVRFEITKRGTGHAVLAQIEARTDKTACDGLTPIASASPRPNGARCLVNADCVSSLCLDTVFGGVCEGCGELGAACDATTVCGFTQPAGPIFAIPAACVPAHAKALGEHCGSDVECASNACTGNACSTCHEGDACGCTAAYTADALASDEFVCGGGSHAVAPGAPCGGDADCASGHCNGAVREQCDDGRACATAATCPAASGLEPGHCNTVGIEDGTCE